MKKTLITIIALLLITLTFAACGKNKKDASLGANVKVTAADNMSAAVRELQIAVNDLDSIQNMDSFNEIYGLDETETPKAPETPYTPTSPARRYDGLRRHFPGRRRYGRRTMPGTNNTVNDINVNDNNDFITLNNPEPENRANININNPPVNPQNTNNTVNNANPNQAPSTDNGVNTPIINNVNNNNPTYNNRTNNNTQSNNLNKARRTPYINNRGANTNNINNTTGGTVNNNAINNNALDNNANTNQTGIIDNTNNAPSNYQNANDNVNYNAANNANDVLSNQTHRNFLTNRRNYNFNNGKPYNIESGYYYEYGADGNYNNYNNDNRFNNTAYNNPDGDSIYITDNTAIRDRSALMGTMRQSTRKAAASNQLSARVTNIRMKIEEIAAKVRSGEIEVSAEQLETINELTAVIRENTDSLKNSRGQLTAMSGEINDIRKSGRNFNGVAHKMIKLNEKIAERDMRVESALTAAELIVAEFNMTANPNNSAVQNYRTYQSGTDMQKQPGNMPQPLVNRSAADNGPVYRHENNGGVQNGGKGVAPLYSAAQ